MTQIVDLKPVRNFLLFPIEIIHDPSLNTQIPEYRLILRKKIIGYLNSQGIQNDLTSLLDLNRIPNVPDLSLSLSHSMGGSVFLWGQGTHLLGVDLEGKHRVTQKVIERVSTPLEIQNCPNPFLLFGAKEAGWKALNSALGIKVISELTCTQWQKVDSNWYSFKLSRAAQIIDGIGFSTQLGGEYLSFYLSTSTFSQINRKNS